MKLDYKKLIVVLVTIGLMVALLLSILTKSNLNILVYAAIFLVIFTAIIIRYDWLICLMIVILSLTNSYIVFNLGINSKVMLVLDYFIAILFVKAIIKIFKYKLRVNQGIIAFLLIVLVGGISFIINAKTGDSINSLYYGLVRFLFLYIGISYTDIDKKKLKAIVISTSIFITIQAPIVFWQSKTLNIVPGTRGVDIEGFMLQDFYSGLLGKKTTTELGFLIIINVIFYYYLYFLKKIKISRLVIVTIMSVITVIINETKMVFILLPIILLILNINKINIKSLVLTIIIITGIFSGYSYVGKLYSGQQGILLDKQKTLDYINMDYAGSGLSRVNSMFIANREISKNFSTVLIGYGPGSGIKNNNGLYNFRTFFFSDIIYEYGYIGFSILIYMLIIHLYYSIKLTSIQNEYIKILGYIGITIFIITMFSGVYSTSMLNISFAAIIWILNSIISRVYCSFKEDSYSLGGLYDKSNNNNTCI